MSESIESGWTYYTIKLLGDCYKRYSILYFFSALRFALSPHQQQCLHVPVFFIFFLFLLSANCGIILIFFLCFRLAAAQEAAQRDPGYTSQYRRRQRLAGQNRLGDWASFGGEVKKFTLLSQLNRLK